MSNEAGERKVTPGGLSSHIRFTSDEYRRLQKDQLLTGRSIPWLLKTHYFKGDLQPPAFDDETARAILRQLTGIGTNLNQIARRLNSGISDGTKEQIAEMLRQVRELRALAARDYGDR